MPEELDNTGKDLVVQFSVKHAQKLDCGGGYIKLIPTSRCSLSLELFILSDFQCPCQQLCSAGYHCWTQLLDSATRSSDC